MRTIEQITASIEEAQRRNRLIQEDIEFLTEKGELRRLFGLPDVFLAIKLNQMKINRDKKDLQRLMDQLS